MRANRWPLHFPSYHDEVMNSHAANTKPLTKRAPSTTSMSRAVSITTRLYLYTATMTLILICLKAEKPPSTKQRTQLNRLPASLANAYRILKTGTLNREYPNFAGDHERLAHRRAVQHITTLKASSVVYYDCCNTWLLEPHECITHAGGHMENAHTIVVALGYCGFQVGRLGTMTTRQP
jgi:hypothetical protein